MNKFLIPIVIFLGAFCYAWFWNCYRLPYCAEGAYIMTAVQEEKELIEGAQGMSDEKEILILKPYIIYFDLADSYIEPTAAIAEFLANSSNYLKEHPDLKIQIVGHADNDGTHITNDRLAIKRAHIVKELFLKTGFKESNLLVSGRGKREPVASNSTDEGRALNRRVSIDLVK